MKLPLLMVCLSTRWYGAARMPRALSRAGFEVSMLTPQDSLAAKSRYIAKIGYLESTTTAAQWVHAFAATVKATSPQFVMPCDDIGLRLLQTLALAPPEGMQPALALQLGALIRDSLGDPAHYRTSIAKTLLPPAAEALGIRVPPYRIVSEIGAAESFAAEHGYPIVMKRDHSSAGDGVMICADREVLAAAFTGLRTQKVDLQDASDSLLVQAHIAGPTKFYPAMAWKGRLLTGYAGEKLVGNPEPKGPPTVNRYYHSPELRAAAEKLAAGFGITGFFSSEFIEDAKTGTAYLIEINRRLVGGAHRGSDFNVDHCAALHAALRGMVPTTRADLDPGEQHLTVHFPQEWLRDPASPWLRTHPVDAPWDDPELFDAMLALRHE